MSFKQAILVRQDLKMRKGKLAGQVAHASLESALKAKPRVLEEWRGEGAKKVVLKVRDMKELKEYIQLSKKLPHALITDAGRTFFAKPITTCLGIGPAEELEIDKITSKLHLI